MRRYLPAVLIVALLAAFRVAGILWPTALPNFQPLAAVFYCGALLLPGWRGFVLPLAIWAVTFPFGIGPVDSLSLFLTTLGALTATFFLGRALSNRGPFVTVAGSAVAAITFHLITSVAAWQTYPLYPKTLAGLWQSIWTGPVGSALPSWVFLQNLVAANVLFTAIFVIGRLPLSAPAASEPLAAK